MATPSLTEKIRFVESVFGRCNLARDEKNISVRCPICDPKDPNKMKLSIRTIDDINHCWVCGWSARTLSPLLKKFGTQEQFRIYIEKFSKVKEVINVLEENHEKKLEIPNSIRLLGSPDEHDPDAMAALKYLKSRDITDRDLWYFRLAYSNAQKWYRRVIFLSHDSHGNVNYVTGRTIDPRISPRYVNCDVERNHVVFNEHNIDWSQSLVLCEGPFDLIKCGENATCMLGSELSETSLLFDRIITNSTPVILAMDSDTKFNKRPRVIKKLQEYDIDVKIVDLGKYPDPGSAPRDFVLQQINSAVPFEWKDRILNKLEKFVL